MSLPKVAFEPIDSALLPADISRLSRTPKRRAQLLMKERPNYSNQLSPNQRQWALKFLLSPVSFDSDQSNPNHVGRVMFRKTEFRDSDKLESNARVRLTEETKFLSASLAFRSVGYKSEPISGLEEIGSLFDHDLGIIPNDIYGRVISPSIGPGSQAAGHVPGLYCAGWVKRGPTGVIASTMEDAFTTADIIAKDWEDRVLFIHGADDGAWRLGWDGLKSEIAKAGSRPISWEDWKRIDNFEKEKGRAAGKEREKLTSVADMLQVVDA